MDYKYKLHYLYGSIGGELWCNSVGQAKELAKGLDLLAELLGETLEVSIVDVETGDVEPLFY